MAWLLSLKVLLISMGMVFIGLSLRASVPLVFEFLVSHVPLMWASFLSWLRPPYLYVIINAIIITIVASTRFHHQSSNKEEHPDPPPSEKNSPQFGMNLDSTVVYEQREEAAVVFEQREEAAVVFEQREEAAVVYEQRVEAMVVYEQREEAAVISVSEVKKAVVVNGSEPQEEEDEEEEEDKFVGSSATSTWLKRIDSPEYLNLSPAEKPLVSARFGHRKPLKASPEGGNGRALRVLKPKRNETLENTWKAITEGRAMPLSRHMKKCETLETHGRQNNFVDPLSSSPVKKSETLKDRTNQQSATAETAASAVNWSPASSTKLRKEPSLSQDELNRRVEAFIKKFNEEMRLQRQESLNQYKEIINSGSR